MNKLINLLLIVILLFPKITLIKLGASATGIRIEDILILIIVLFFIVNIIKKNKKVKIPIKMNKIVKIFCIYILMNLFSYIYGVARNWINPLISILYIFRKNEYFLMLFIGYYYFFNCKSIDKFLNRMDVILYIHTFISFLQLKGIIGSVNHGVLINELTQGRISSTFNGAYEYSAFLLLLLPIFLNKIIGDNKYTIKNFFDVFLIFLNILISESRSSIIIFLIIFFSMFIKFKKINYRKILKKLFLLTCIGSIMLILIVILFSGNNDIRIINSIKNFNVDSIENIFKLSWNYRNFNSYITQNNWYGNCPYTLGEISSMGMDASLYMRVSHWCQMIDGFIQSPIIGLGPSITTNAADGNYVRIIFESGILGLSLWIIFLLSIYKALKEEKNVFEVISKYQLISICMGAIFIDVFEASKIMMLFWFFLGLNFANLSKKIELEKDLKNENKKYNYSK